MSPEDPGVSARSRWASPFRIGFRGFLYPICTAVAILTCFGLSNGCPHGMQFELCWLLDFLLYYYFNVSRVALAILSTPALRPWDCSNSCAGFDLHSIVSRWIGRWKAADEVLAIQAI